MPTIGSPTLEQIRTLLAVVDAGSFSEAARRLNRRQSVVSYTIAGLEEQLGGLVLFDRSTRRPTLTDAGRAVLAEARKLAADASALKARAAGLIAGLESELRLVVDVMFPRPRLVAALAAFRAAFPTVPIRLAIEALGAVDRLVRDGDADVGVSGPRLNPAYGLAQRRIGAVRMLPVAAPAHPLGRREGPVRIADLRDEIQLVLTDRSELTRGQDFNVFSAETWRLGDLGAKYDLLIAGLGWGSMPDAMVADDLAAGRLREIVIEGHVPADYALHGIHRSDAPPGPAGRWFIDHLASA